MGRSVATLDRAFAYQARFFWWIAGSRILAAKSPLAEVGYDVPDIDGFDDVVVRWAQPDRDSHGRDVELDLYQVKWHVNYADSITANALTDPRWIGSTSNSFLQRVRSCSNRLATPECARLWLATTYIVDQDDTLAHLIDGSEGALRLHEFAKGGPKSAIGRTRQVWKEHLDLDSDEELFELLRPVRIMQKALDYKQLAIELERWLPPAGLRLPSQVNAIEPYESLIRKLLSEGRYRFNEAQLRDECGRAGLSTDTPFVPPNSKPRIGIRSFVHPRDDMPDWSDKYLPVLEYFDGRFLKPEHSWEEVALLLEAFILDVVSNNNRFELRLDAHQTLAFFAGAVLKPKLGVAVDLVQRGRAGTNCWSTTGIPSDPKLTTNTTDLGLGPDIVMNLSITSNISSELNAYLATASVPTGQVINLQPEGGPSQSAVTSGEHALGIADEVIRLVQAARPSNGQQSRIHVFAACPNAVMFLLGQQYPALGQVTVYEYDFEGTRSGSYEPSLALPIS